MANPFDAPAPIEPEIQNGQDQLHWAVPPQQALQQVKTQYTTAVAVQQPRSLKEVERRLLEEARLLGDDAYYGWGAGKDRVEGPSIDLAESAARCFGNCAVECRDVTETQTAYLYTAYFIDLETGYTLSRPFRQSRAWTVYGKLDPERKEDIRFQIGATKATRNVILNALPKFLINRAMDVAKEGVRAKIEKYITEHSIDAARELMIKELAKCTVKEDAILAKMERRTKEALTVDDLVTLSGSLRALQKREEIPNELFPPPVAASPSASDEKKAGSVDALKDTLKAKTGLKEAAKPEDTKPEPIGTTTQVDLPLDSKE